MVERSQSNRRFFGIPVHGAAFGNNRRPLFILQKLRFKVLQELQFKRLLASTPELVSFGRSPGDYLCGKQWGDT
jgi:hypothetical protein